MWVCEPIGLSDAEDSDYEWDPLYTDYVEQQLIRSTMLKQCLRVSEAILEQNLTKTIHEINRLNIDYNAILVNSGTSPLHLACRIACAEIVQYLLENGANVNLQVDTSTPLMEVCKFPSNVKEKEEQINQIVLLLLSKQAEINICDKNGMSPFLYACERGHLNILKKLLPYVSLETKTIYNQSALFIAIEKNHIEVVKFLIASGIKCDDVDSKGYTARQVAENFGFNDILDILPIQKATYVIQDSLLRYNSIRDHIPRIFLKSEIPEFYQEIYEILNAIGLERFFKNLVHSKVNFNEFLTLTDEQMKEVGIIFPYQRNLIRLGLLHFHLNHWSKKMIGRVKNDNDSFYDVLMLSANHLRNLIAVNAALKFVSQNLNEGSFGAVEQAEIIKIRKSIMNYKLALKDLTKTTIYLNSFSTEKPINYDDFIKEKRLSMLKSCVKYSLLIGVSIIICIKFNPFKFFK